LHCAKLVGKDGKNAKSKEKEKLMRKIEATRKFVAFYIIYIVGKYPLFSPVGKFF
jgi:hypothetical protein